MDWTAETIDQLYELYDRHVDRLRAHIVQTNRSLGSWNPEKTSLDDLTRAEFEALLKEPTVDPEATQLWVRRIIRGHEQEFPELRVVDQLHRRATGT